MLLLTCLILGIVIWAAPAAGQNDQAPAAEPGTELDALVGAASSATHTGPVVAGIAGWRFANWARGEARGTWLARGTGAEAFEADLGAALHLRTGRSAHPYVGAAFGLYHASFTSPGAMMSDFYRQRLGVGMTAAGGQTFTDPVWRLSAGVDMRLRHGLSIRPEASALFIRRDGRGETLGLFGLRIGYRFSDRIATP